MTCVICGASCRCRKRGPGICCSCHRHKTRAVRTEFSIDMKCTREEFEASLRKHLPADKNAPPAEQLDLL